MFQRLAIPALFALPLVLMGALYAFGLSIPVPELGRGYVVRVGLPDPDSRIGLPDISGPQDLSRPLVVIDAGHGGHDPGAVRGSVQEKRIVLSLAQQVRDRLVENGGIRVALTREDDRFLVLEERASIARRLGADLFVSIHADAADNTEATGATVYTRSERASDPEAAALAARENRADRINGVDMAEQSDAVSDILIDLSQRRKQAGSREFAQLLVREGRGDIPFHSDPVRSAAFVVLRSPDMPSVLFELGYVSNESDAERLNSQAERSKLSETLEQAIRVFFARQSSN